MATVKCNGVAYDFKNLEVSFATVAGQQFGINSALDELSYSISIENEQFYGGHRLPQIRTEGQAEFEASCTMAVYWWTYIRRRARVLGIPLGSLELNLAVSYVTRDEEILTDTLFRTKLLGLENDHSNGPENLMVTVPLQPMNIYYQGEDWFGNRL